MSQPPYSKDLTKEQKDQQAILKALSGTVQHYFGSWQQLFGGVQDPRNPLFIVYPLNCLLFTATLLFLCRLGPSRGIQDRFRGNTPSSAKFTAWFGTEEAPHGDTLNYSFHTCSPSRCKKWSAAVSNN